MSGTAGVSNGMRIVFLGTPQFAVPSLSILREIDFVETTGVITHPDKPMGRHLVMSPHPVKISAQRLNIPVYQPERVSNADFIKELKKIGIDLMVIVSFGEILSKEILRIPKIGCVNVHSSLLPKYRGAAPVAWAIMNGEKKTGVTTFWLSEKMDSGDIILQKEIDIMPSDNRGTLEEKLSIAGAELLKETIQKIKNGTAPRKRQDESMVLYARKIKKGDGLIDWSKDAVCIYNKIRAMNPWPAAYTFFKGKRVEIWESDFRGENADGKPGEIVILDKDGIGIATGAGILIIKELQAEAKKRQKAVDFVHGYRLNEGDSFD